MNTSSSGFSDSKQHYPALDGLRGVAAVMVVIFHLFEPFSNADHTKQIINHGYLAVDFFFVLSGFVIGYAYDDRWKGMTLKAFFVRRLIRLHPMIILGMFVGTLAFYSSASPILFPGIAGTPMTALLITFLVGCTLLPVPPSLDIRGWGEMHPLNGPAWSLFFEYCANIAYALLLRKLSTRVLSLLAVIAGAALIHLAVTGPNGDVIGGWSLEPSQFLIGLTRLSYPFLAGLLISRFPLSGKPLRHAFLWSSLIIIAALSFPRVGGTDALWMNGIYDSAVIMVIFPLVVLLGAHDGELMGSSAGVVRFLGDLSYPLYITHFPFIYIYTSWIVDRQVTMAEAWPVAAAILIGCIALAYAALRWYDAPLRRRLSRSIRVR